jgi:hypothetical protein
MEGGYRKLLLALSINTVWMFLSAGVMVREWAHYLPNVNWLYMALFMVAPMGLTMLVVMRSMFMDKRMNVVLFVSFAVLLVLSFAAIRTQAFVGNDAFLRAMIPHHSGAIVMCDESAVTDPQIEALCDQIVAAQREEIAEMKALLAEDR